MKLISPSGQITSLDRPQTTIGRATSNDVVVSDPRVSGHHASIVRDGDVLILRDVGSSNGTYLNDQPIQGSARLRGGDHIRVGHTVLTIQSEGGIAADRTVLDVQRSGSAAQGVIPGAQVVVAPAMPQVVSPYGVLLYPPKDKASAMLLEILPGLVGLLGFGWIYAGEIGIGLAFLLGNLTYLCIGTVIAVVTSGIGLICLWPLEVGVLVTSAILLNSHMSARPAQFR